MAISSPGSKRSSSDQGNGKKTSDLSVISTEVKDTLSAVPVQLDKQQDVSG